MKILLLCFIIIIVFPNTSIGQVNPLGSGLTFCGIYFDYDPAGNCVKRYYDCKYFTTEIADHGGDVTSRIAKSNDTGRVALLTDAVKLSPNPTSGRFTITISEDTRTHFHIYDVKGAILGSGYIENKKYEADISQVSPGTYIVIVYFKEKPYTFRVTKN